MTDRETLRRELVKLRKGNGLVLGSGTPDYAKVQRCPALMAALGAATAMQAYERFAAMVRDIGVVNALAPVDRDTAYSGALHNIYGFGPSRAASAIERRTDYAVHVALYSEALVEQWENEQIEQLLDTITNQIYQMTMLLVSGMLEGGIITSIIELYQVADDIATGYRKKAATTRNGNGTNVVIYPLTATVDDLVIGVTCKDGPPPTTFEAWSCLDITDYSLRNKQRQAMRAEPTERHPKHHGNFIIDASSVYAQFESPRPMLYVFEFSK